MKLNNLKNWTLKISGIIIIAGVFFIVNTIKTDAAINPMVKFEGKVTNLDGSEVPDGVYDFNFAIYSQPTGGAALWAENLTAANMFSGDIAAVTRNADSITYDYSGSLATGTLRVGQYLYNADTEEAALIIDFNTGAGTVTVASGSPEWTAGQAVNNRPFVTGGVIDINLGSAADLSAVDFNQPLYLEITFNGEVMQPRKNVAAVYQSFESARLGGKAEDEFAGLAENETVTGQWSFNNIVNIATSTDQTALTISQNGNGKIVEFNTATGTAFAVFANGLVQIGNYYLPATHGAAGYNLKTDINGNLYWGPDLIGGGDSSGLWSSTTDVTYGDIMIESDAARKVVVGNNILTGPVSTQFEIQGLSWLDTVGISAQNQLQFYDADSSNYFALRATGTLASNFILTLPAGLGAAGEALLTNADGNLYWGSPSGFTYVNPGTAGQMPYYASNGSALSATSTIFVSPSGNVGIGTASPTQLLTVGQTSGSQFIVNALGQVLTGTWQGSQINAAYGGTGSTTLTGILKGNGTNGVLSATPGVDYLSPSAIGSTVQGFDAGLSAMSGLASTTDGLFIVGSVSGWTGSNIIQTRSTLGLTSAYDNAQYFITSSGANGNIWMSDGTASGTWAATSSLSIALSDTTGILPVNRGGTGTTTFSQYALVYASAANIISEILPGAEGQVLIISGGRPTWVASTTGAAHSLLSSAHTDTTPSAVIRGDLITGQGASAAWSRLALGPSGSYITSNGVEIAWATSSLGTAYGGTGTSTAGWTSLPFVNNGVWESTTTLSAAYGGTGFNAFNTGDLIYAGSASTLSKLAAGGIGEILVVSPSGIPSWVSTSSLNIDASNMTGIVDTAHGGTGQNFSANTGFIYLNNGVASASNTIAIIRTDLAAGSGITLSGNILTLDTSGNWSGTFDNQEGSYYLNAVNLTNFESPFALALSATTTDALVQGIVNKYYSTGLFEADLLATTTDALTEGSRLYWTNERFDTRLSATTSLPNVTALTGLSTVGTISSGTWQGNTLSVAYGGTGTTTFQANSLIYASAANTVSEIIAGSDGYVLKMNGGIPRWEADLAGGSSVNFWATSSNNLLIHPSTITQIVVIGAVSTSTTGKIFEVAGDSLFGGSISAQSLSLINSLSVANGGTGSSAPSGILVGDGAGNIVSLSNNSTDWNTAFTWGDHSSQNYFVKGVDIASVAMGGTGTTTFQANSLLFASAANTIGEIAAGSEGDVLVMDSGVPTWSSAVPGAAHDILSAQHSDAAATTTVRGDLMSVDASGDWNRLGLGPDGYILRSNGTDASWMSTVNITSLGTITSGVWNGSPIDVAYGGTGATNATSARANLGLDGIYDFGITSTGTTGWLWQSDGDGRGHWVATTSLGIASSGGYDTIVGTTTYTTNGDFATSTLVGYQAANDICNYEYPGSHFCRTHEILYTIQLENISNWGNDSSSAWIAEGPPGYTYDSNDCNGYTDSLNTKLGAFWLFNSNGGGAGWLVNCEQVKALACCKVQ